MYMYMYIYMYIYVYMCICVYVYMCMYTHISICIRKCIYIYYTYLGLFEIWQPPNLMDDHHFPFHRLPLIVGQFPISRHLHRLKLGY